MKKLFAILLALVMMLSMAAMAAADGSITINNTTTNADYKIYKVFDATYAIIEGADGEEETQIAYTYTKTGDSDDLFDVLTGAGSPFELEASSTANVYNVTSDESAATIAAWLKANEAYLTKTGEGKGNGGALAFTGLDYGYYYITSSVGTVVTIDNVTPSVTVNDKNETQPNVPSDGQLKSADENSAAIGETVKYTVNFNAVNFVTKDGVTTQVTEYTINDTPDALDIDKDSVKIVVAMDDPATEAVETEWDITSTATKTKETNGNLNIVIPWDDADGAPIYASPVEVTITYSAVVTAAADDGNATNKVVVNYNDDELEGTEEVKTYKVTINKVDGDRNPLDGAEFELYASETGTDKIAVVAIDANGAVISAATYNAEDYDLANVKYYRVAEADEVAEAVVVKAGTAIIKGLDGDKDYWLEETKAPEGFNKLTAREQVDFSTEGTDGAITFEDDTVTVVNNAGSTLPSTGGIGTTIFYVVGGLMMAAAVVILVAKKKVSAK